MADIEKLNHLLSGVGYGQSYHLKGRHGLEIKDRELILPLGFASLWAQYDVEGLSGLPAPGSVPRIIGSCVKIVAQCDVSLRDSSIGPLAKRKSEFRETARRLEVSGLSVAKAARSAFDSHYPNFAESGRVAKLLEIGLPVGLDTPGQAATYWFNGDGNLAMPNDKDLASPFNCDTDGSEPARAYWSSYHGIMDALILQSAQTPEELQPLAIPEGLWDRAAFVGPDPVSVGE